MKVSPLNIKKQEFSKSVRGFDKEEVQAFLNKLADEFETVLNENEKLKIELKEANLKLNEYKKIEKNLQDTLLKAQEASSKTIEATKKQTNLMIKEAEIKASQILERARENANEIRNAVINLREEKNLIIAKLKALIGSQEKLLNLSVSNAGENPEGKNESSNTEKLKLDIDNIVNKLL